MAFAASSQALNRTLTPTTSRSTIYSPVSQPSCSPRCAPALFPMHQRQSTRSHVATKAYRNGNCQDSYRRGFPWGPFTMGPDAAMAGAALADMARKFANSNQGFNQGMNGSEQQVPLFVDLLEAENQYLLTADVPGLQKSDLKITVNPKERTLKVSGERKRSGEFNKASSEENQKFRRQFERRMGKFQRTFSMIPENADLTSVAARVDKGVLTITVQKTVTTEADDTMDINIE